MFLLCMQSDANSQPSIFGDRPMTPLYDEAAPDLSLVPEPEPEQQEHADEEEKQEHADEEKEQQHADEKEQEQEQEQEHADEKEQEHADEKEQHADEELNQIEERVTEDTRDITPSPPRPPTPSNRHSLPRNSRNWVCAMLVNFAENARKYIWSSKSEAIVLTDDTPPN